MTVVKWVVDASLVISIRCSYEQSMGTAMLLLAHLVPAHPKGMTASIRSLLG